MSEEAHKTKPWDASDHIRTWAEARAYLSATIEFNDEKLANEAFNDVGKAFDRLAGENKRLREALTPSAETKHAYIGEFKFTVSDFADVGDDGELVEVAREVLVPWDTVKEIMKAIRARAALSDN